MSVGINAAGLALGIAILTTVPAWAQRTSPNWPSPPAAAEGMPQSHPSRNANLEQMQRAAEERRMQLQKDTNRLSELVNELKQALERTPAGTVSVDAVKKSRDVERLARRVRKEMEGD